MLSEAVHGILSGISGQAAMPGFLVEVPMTLKGAKHEYVCTLRRNDIREPFIVLIVM